MALIARETELAGLVERVREHRLVTVVGPGGVGKTALARAAADLVGPEFAYGALTADLTRVDDPDAVEELIAGQLGVADFESLINSPSDQPALLVIDNCEHVLDAAAAAIDLILGACRMPTVLATSRSPLDVAEEVIVPLAPLSVPPPGYDDPGAAAARMFVERVAAFGGAVGPSDSAAVAAICRLLDGVPLALEIAAARSRTSTLDGILAEIEASPGDLARRRFRGHTAHRSVAHMVERSLGLLDAEIRAAFEQLGVIAGPFDCAMADAVVSVAGAPSIDAVLDELAAASLIVADTSGNEVWYRLLHPVRAVALDRLRQSGGEAAAIGRAVDHVVAVAIGVVVGSSAGWSGQLRMLLALYDNMIASLKWADQHDERPDRALTLLAVLWGVIHQSHTAEVASVGEAVLTRWNDRDAPFWADAAATVATCRNLLGRHDDAIELATEALDHVGRSPFAPGSLRRVIAQAHRASGRPAESQDWFAEAATVAADAGVHGLAMELWVDHAVVAAELGAVESALGIVERVLDEAIAADAEVNLAWARCGRGAILLTAGDPVALETLDEAVAYSRSIAYPAGVSFGLRMVAAAHLERDDRVAAACALLDLLDALLERGGLNDLRMALDHVATLLEREGDDRWLDVAATASALPVTSVASAVESPVLERAAGRGAAMPTREVYSLCRDVLGEIVSRSSAAADADGTVSTDARTETISVDEAAPSSNALVLEGDVWRCSYGGASVMVKASKGMSDLARLLAAPGREIAALDLMGSAKVGDTAPETLDVTARRALEERIVELQADLDEADAHHDVGRSELAAAELDRLVDELGAAVGIGGRARATGSDPERARSAVTQRIRSTIARIDRMHSRLGGHLATSIETGTFCSYRPAEPVDWQIER